MRLVLKIFADPVVAILTVFVALMMFLLHIAAWLMGLVSVLLAIVGVALLFTQKYIGGGGLSAPCFSGLSLWAPNNGGMAISKGAIP